MNCGAYPNSLPDFECPGAVLDLTLLSSLDLISNCTIINGNLVIIGLSNTQCGANGLSLPRLLQVLGSVTVEYSSCTSDLSNFLPNLVAIHGISLFTPPVSIAGKATLAPYSLLIHHTALSGIGLKCLRVLGETGVQLLDNPQMCYVDTVGWHLLTPFVSPWKIHTFNDSLERRSGSSVYGQDLLRKVGLYDLCANACPPKCNRVTVDNLPRSFCWSQDECQYICAAKCREASLSCSVQNASQCCHPTCLGGCTGPAANDCLVCRNFRLNNMCISSCPNGFYELFGRYCVSRETCLFKPIPKDLLLSLESTRLSDSLPVNFSIQGNACVPICAKGFRRSSSGECLPCDVECDSKWKKECGDIVIYQQADLASVKHCVSARSVLISIRTGQDDLSTALADAFSSLRVIYRSLRVIRSDALLSLSFLHHLTAIHGKEALPVDEKGASSEFSPEITALEITWNANLEDLWSLPSGARKLQINSGSVEFSVNNRLCPEKIQSFLGNRVVFTTGRDLTPSELDLINTSNGEYALCNAKPLNVTITDVLQNSITLRMNRMAWNDPRQILPAIISYGRRENRNLLSETSDRTFCDSTWNEVELSCSLPPSSNNLTPSMSIGSSHGDEILTCQLDNLAPATSYSAFITIATLSKHEGAQSRRFQFTTKPATPSTPTSLRALSAGPTSIQLHWDPPSRPNGKIAEYRIRYTQMKLEKNDFLSRDACYSIPFQPQTYASPTSVESSGKSSSSRSSVDRQDVSLDTAENNDDVGGGSTPSSTKGLKRLEINMEELQRREMIRFEDELHKIILIPRVPYKKPRRRPKRSLWMRRFYEYAQKDDFLLENSLHLVRRRRNVGATNFTLPQKTVRVPATPDMNGESTASNKLGFLVTGLEHFTEYLFLISACHEPHDELGNPLHCVGDDCDPDLDAGCSQPVRISQRTQAVPHADEVPSTSLYALTPPFPTNGQSSERLSDALANLSQLSQSSNSVFPDIHQGESAKTVKLFWNEPCSPNGLILYYWLQYRRMEDVNKNASLSLPWFTICVAPRYLEGDSVNAAFARFGSNHSHPEPYPHSNNSRTVFTELGFLRAGYYEWQVMAVSLAGNGSWTQSHFFNVHTTSSMQPSHVAAVLLVTLLALGLVVGFAIWFDHRNRKRRLNALTNQRSEYLESLLLQNFQDEWEVDPKDLTYNVDETLGHGSFGMVCKGRLKRLTTPAAEYLQHTPISTRAVNVVDDGGRSSPQIPAIASFRNPKIWLSAFFSKKFRRDPAELDDHSGIDVAVKILSPGSTYEDVREFLGEASHMKQFSCNHIVRLLGIVSKQVLIRRQPIVVMELMQHGDLATYLRHRMAQEDYSQGSVAPDLAIKWAAEVADGMAYLEHKGFVHRDLAARNCLVGIGLTVKIGDFGLTRDISEHLYYRKQGRARLPVRWMAPEALNEAYFTFKSDVWSYGVVLWEIATFAALPFSGLSHEEVIALVVNGGHLGKQGWPSKFPPILLDVMQACWHSDPEDRPSFGSIIRMLEPYVGRTFRMNSFFLNESSPAILEIGQQRTVDDVNTQEESEEPDLVTY